ncbi:Hypothetical_protein [Hexamita inflata]|uniref:Hypothetical_protein n=1 Tax=Hexamita inflata TaxID=28002 RepID=A0AA86PVP0_9EUKA|nr:Hypothetical protein HINF_LOCUS33523 [Hexamita inflata]
MNFVIKQQLPEATLQRQMNKYNIGYENNLSHEQQIQLQSVIRETQKPDFEVEEYINVVPQLRGCYFKQTQIQLLHKRGIMDLDNFFLFRQALVESSIFHPFRATYFPVLELYCLMHLNVQYSGLLLVQVEQHNLKFYDFHEILLGFHSLCMACCNFRLHMQPCIQQPYQLN